MGGKTGAGFTVNIESGIRARLKQCLDLIVVAGNRHHLSGVADLPEHFDREQHGFKPDQGTGYFGTAGVTRYGCVGIDSPG